MYDGSKTGMEILASFVSRISVLENVHYLAFGSSCSARNTFPSLSRPTWNPACTHARLRSYPQDSHAIFTQCSNTQKTRPRCEDSLRHGKERQLRFHQCSECDQRYQSQTGTSSYPDGILCTPSRVTSVARQTPLRSGFAKPIPVGPQNKGK